MYSNISIRFNNTVRIHSHCKYQSPDEYEAAYSKRLSELKQGLAGEGEKSYV